MPKVSSTEKTAQEIIEHVQEYPGYLKSIAYTKRAGDKYEAYVEIWCGNDTIDYTDTLRIPLSFFIKKREAAPKGKRPYTKRSPVWNTGKVDTNTEGQE